jgi:hypothetical protein
MEQQEKVQGQEVMAKVAILVPGKAVIRSPRHNRNLNHHHHCPQEMRTSEVKVILAGRILLPRRRPMEAVLHRLLHHLLHHRSHHVAQEAQVVQTHQIPVRPRKEGSPLIRNERSVDYVES